MNIFFLVKTVKARWKYLRAYVTKELRALDLAKSGSGCNVHVTRTLQTNGVSEGHYSKDSEMSVCTQVSPDEQIQAGNSGKQPTRPSDNTLFNIQLHQQMNCPEPLLTQIPQSLSRPYLCLGEYVRTNGSCPVR